MDKYAAVRSRLVTFTGERRRWGYRRVWMEAQTSWLLPVAVMWCTTSGARRVCGSLLAKLLNNGACLCQHPARSERRVRGKCGRWTSSLIATTKAKPYKNCNVIDEFTGEHGGFEGRSVNDRYCND